MEKEITKLEGEIIEGETSTPTTEEEIPELNSTPIPTDTDDTDVGEKEVAVETETEESSENPFSIDSKIFTQSQVDEIAGKTRVDTREKTFKYIYGRYGVNNEEELDEMVGRGQRFDLLQEEFDNAKTEWNTRNSEREKELAQVKEQIALMQSDIDSSRYEDAKLILKGKGLDITVENIERELATHPEWSKKSQTENFVKVEDKSPVESKISVLGNDTQKYDASRDEEEFALNNIFKV